MVLAKLKDTSVEINDVGDLLRVVRQVHSSEEPLVIQGDGGHEFVVPASPHSKRRRKTPEEKAKADEEAFRSAAGGWKDLFDDPEELIKQIYDARGQRPRSIDALLSQE